MQPTEPESTNPEAPASPATSPDNSSQPAATAGTAPDPAPVPPATGAPSYGGQPYDAQPYPGQQHQPQPYQPQPYAGQQQQQAYYPGQQPPAQQQQQQAPAPQSQYAQQQPYPGQPNPPSQPYQGQQYQPQYQAPASQSPSGQPYQQQPYPTQAYPGQPQAAAPYASQDPYPAASYGQPVPTSSYGQPSLVSTQPAPSTPAAPAGFDPRVYGVPEEAMARLKDNAAGAEGAVFSAGFTPAEVAKLGKSGFSPVGVALGSAIFSIAAQTADWGQNLEIGPLTLAMQQARELALARLGAQAHSLGADGVIAVQMTVEIQPWGGSIAEFRAVGTAIKADAKASSDSESADSEDAAKDWHDSRGRPFTTSLQAADFCDLLESGRAPVAIVMGTCVYFLAHHVLPQVLASVAPNSELSFFTQGLYQAREMALGRMQKDAKSVDASGVVAVSIAQNPHSWGNRASEFFVSGTAVRPL
jgi:uncharacterized protein YbjQ (UPF0145 family)